MQFNQKRKTLLLFCKTNIINDKSGVCRKKDSAISANLDYTSDSRWYVSVATDLLEFFGWE